MLISKLVFLVQKGQGKVIILCYKSNEAISIFTLLLRTVYVGVIMFIVNGAGRHFEDWFHLSYGHLVRVFQALVEGCYEGSWSSLFSKFSFVF